jgi:hypothetical protein
MVIIKCVGKYCIEKTWILLGLKFGLNEKKRKCNKRNFYCSYSVRVLETAANNLKIQNLKIVDLNRDHVKSLLTEASKMD